MRRRIRLAEGSGRVLAVLALVAAVPLAGWLTLRYGPESGLATLALGGALLCVIAARRGR
jgi:hypothetical protein